MYPHPSSPAATAVMRANRSKDTVPEIRLRSALHRSGLRFRKAYLVQSNGMRVRVDIGFPSRRVAVFVDGCFWHSCPSHGVVPSVNQGYWLPKLKRNVDRDAFVNEWLIKVGWIVVRVWEHESLAEAVEHVAEVLHGRDRRGLAPAPGKPGRSEPTPLP